MPLSKEESDEFLNRVERVLAEELKNSYDHQIVVLLDALDDLIAQYGMENITDDWIRGAWDVATHLHPSDGSLRY
jgi:hypothetical protein